MLTAFNQSASTVLAARVDVAASFGSRVKGLIGRKNLPPGNGLWIRPCNSIHCFFMAFPIDVIYLDAENQIVGLDENMQPWRVGRPRLRAKSVLELPAGTVEKTNAQLGDEIVFS